MPTKRVGRPPLPAAERKSARVTLRLDRADARLLSAMQGALSLNETDVLRRALHELAAQTGGAR